MFPFHNVPAILATLPQAAIEKVDLACDKIRALEDNHLRDPVGSFALCCESLQADPAAPSKEADVCAQDANVAVRSLSRRTVHDDLIVLSWRSAIAACTALASLFTLLVINFRYFFKL